jgi:hypothetical protein
MTVILRSEKGASLTHSEVDTNFRDLREGVNSQVPKTKGDGILLGPYGSETFGWNDLVGTLQVYGELGEGVRQVYRGGIKAVQVVEGESAYIDFHLPHDYAPDTDIYIHVHWSHNSALVTGGSVTWGFELLYAKGHDQAVFLEPIVISVAQNASLVQYRHMVAEGLASASGGSAVLLDTDTIETDGIIQCRVFLDSNDITVSGGVIPDPFIHAVDIHYQTTNVATKNRSPNFWG